MIPVYNEEPEASRISENSDARLYEKCIFCHNTTTTWHENTNNPVCVTCASKKKVSDITEDHGKNIRYMKRKGTFDRGGCTRAN